MTEGMTPVNFFASTFDSVRAHESKENIFYDDLMFDSHIQDAASVRNIMKTRKIAAALIDFKGLLDDKKLDEVITYMKEHRFVLGPHYEHDAPREEHLLRMLELIRHDKEIRMAIKMIGRPLSYPYVDELIRDTLHLPSKHQVTDADAKRAVLSALFCYFRQNVGSCFATAPAIIIHNEQPLLFLNDCRELMNTGRLKRTFGGIEYAVPLSPSWGAATLRKPIFLDKKGSQITKDQSFVLAMQAAKISDVKKIVESALAGFRGGFMTPENVMKATFLYHNNLTEEDIKEAEERSMDSLQQRLFLEVSTKRGKQELIRQFNEQFQMAKRAFKRLSDNPILRTWEYTLASFAESKSDFFKWNLYTSLGFTPEDTGGLGPCMHQFLTDKLKEHQRKVDEHQRHYEKVFLEVKALESGAKTISSESQMNWYKIQYTARINDLNYHLDERDKAHDKAKKISELYPHLVKIYVEKLPEYFQEIYDADMHMESEGLYDDSPAGFRLLFKHGRSNPAVWTMIYTSQQYIDFLVDFFTLTEIEITSNEAVEGLEKDVSTLISEMIHHLRRPEFIESATKRVAHSHGSASIKKPWAYTSGGSMQSLISTIYSREEPPTESSRWVESEMELLVFLADTLKEMPSNLTLPFGKDSKKSMLAYSPTHAFTVKPGLDPFIQAWMETGYTYTWVRDHLFQPRKAFVQNLYLTSGMMERMGEEFCKELPVEIAHLLRKVFYKLSSYQTPSQFRHQLIAELVNESWVKKLGRIPLSLEELDEKLYTMLPMTPTEDISSRVTQILQHVLGQNIDLNTIYEPLSQINTSYISACDLLDLAKACLLLITQKTTFSLDYHHEIVLAMQALGFAQPRPLFFGDTNWSNNYFGFVVSPGTENLELWRLDYTGHTGRPMHAWKEWLDGTHQKPWGLYNRPYEYEQS